MKKQNKQRLQLGDLITALFEEAKRVSRNQKEQTALVYMALSDLLKGRVHGRHQIALVRARR